MGGRIKPIIDQDPGPPTFHVEECSGPSDPDDWQGASGSPVFLAGKVIVVYEPRTVAALARSAAEPEAFCLDLPAGLATAAEVIMAGLRMRPVHFRDLPDRDSLPVPRDLLDTPPDEGFNQDGTAFLRNVERDLAFRLGLEAEEGLVASE